MSIDHLKETLPEYAKDIRLNLSTVLTEEGASDLTQKQIASIALTSAYATRNKPVITATTQHVNTQLSSDEIDAAKAAATLMAMNNIYYRFTHAMDDQSYATLPVKLRMTKMAQPGNDKVLFELSSLAVSAINGCTKCMNAHAMQLEKAGVSKTGIQSAIRIASVMQATAIALEIAG